MKHLGQFLFLIIGIGVSGCLTVELPKVQIDKGTESKSLTWPFLVRQSLAYNPDLQEARSLVSSSARSRDIAFGDYLPSVEGGLQKTVARTTNTSSTADTLGLNLSARQSLFDGFGTTGEWMKARKNLEAVQLAYIETSADVRYQLRSAYINVIRFQRLFQTNQLIYQRRKQNAELVRLRYEAGRENVGSALRAEAIAEQAAFDVRQTGRLLESEALRLARESGGEFVIPIRIEDDLEKMLGEVRLAEADYVVLAERTPTVLRIVKTAEAAKAAVLSAQSDVWPQVNGTYDYGYTGDRAEHLRDKSSLGLSVTVPFFEGGKNVAAIRKAKSDYDAAKKAAQSARDEAIAALAAAWVPYKDAIESVEVKKKFLDAAQKRAEIIRAEYTTGLVNFTDFDAAEQENANAEKEYVESLARVFTQKANWEKTQGATLEDAYDEIQNQ
ncbi:MAG TPA: TolC family protein [Candidatus Omnitrophota bacterium]|nr:TolC family protein [Candidatus Omnitrophota bacterium]